VISRAVDIHQRLLARGETVSTAESMTAGLLGAALTETPGASATYRGGLIVYATDLKAQLAGVDADLLAQRGAVDPDVAAALAAGVRDRLRSTWGLGLTGVAGPDAQDGKSVGTLFIALAGPRGQLIVAADELDGDRAAIRAGAVGVALNVLYNAVAHGE
jgi:nicotinamide-nucleotide amidase